MAKKTIDITVEGMSCSHCENSVKKAVVALAGVDRVSVVLADKIVTVEFDPDKIIEKQIFEAIEDQGYDVVQ